MQGRYKGQLSSCLQRSITVPQSVLTKCWTLSSLCPQQAFFEHPLYAREAGALGCTRGWGFLLAEELGSSSVDSEEPSEDYEPRGSPARSGLKVDHAGLRGP